MKNKITIFLLLIITISFLSAEEVTLDIMFTNDLHGGIDVYPATYMNPAFPPILGGGGSAAVYIKNVRELTNQKDRDNLLIDAGDFFAGHPIGSVSKGKSIIKYMNMVDYDVTVVGNHEFDIPQDSLKAAYALAEFPILTANVIDKETGKIVDYAQPYMIVEKVGVKIGIIGLTTTDTKKMADQDNIASVKFLNTKETLKKYVKILKDKGVDLIIVNGHMGLPYKPQERYDKRYGENIHKETGNKYWGYDAQQLAHEVEGVDLFIGGHMHKGFSEPWVDPLTHAMVIQGYAYGSNINHISLKIDKETKSISGYKLPDQRSGLMVTLFKDEFLADEAVADSILSMQKRAEKGMDEVIGMTKTNLTRGGTGAQNKMGNLIADAMRAQVDADFSFINLGGIRDEIVMGPITLRHIFDVMPFDNQLVVLNITGKTLKKIIETRVSHGHQGLLVSGVNVIYNKNRPNFDRVTKLLIGGEPWDPDKMYRVTTTDFILQGNVSLEMLTKIPEDQIERPEIAIRDAIANYIKKNSPVTSQIDDRWKRDDHAKPTKALLDALKK